METVIYQPIPESIDRCAQILRDGGLVAFPTETVYGLGANAFDPDAVRKIYEAKGRPSDNPLIVHIAETEQLHALVEYVSPLAQTLIAAFMPGPLTLVFRKKAAIPDCVTGGLDTVGIRMPSHPAAVKLLRACGLPICAPSANLSTKPSPTTAKHVLADLNGRIPAILDGGACDVGLESTILDVSGERPRLLRRGGVPEEQLLPITGALTDVPSSSVALCPGMKYKHYAPDAEVYFSTYYDGMTDRIATAYDRLTADGKKPVILCLTGNAAQYGARSHYVVGEDFEAYAHNAFALLRRADDEGYDAVIAEGVDAKGIGESLINRLIKSSGGKVI